ncbi:TPA: RNA 3'-phosphate cyclase, partial [Candidatus Bathyarchaeota archaeon]|nr:RNA 3'-phosphate cyclase [Candidatus Bathyarchaeota archaeon]
LLKVRGYDSKIRIVNDFSNPIQKGSSLVLWARTNSDVILGSDAIGELRKSSEAVAREAAKNLLDEIQAKPTVDIHLADMLIPYIALADGESIYSTRFITDHIESNMWLVNEILGVSLTVEKSGSLIRLSKR